MIVRLFTSVAAHLVRNLTERPSEMHPSVEDWRTIALTIKSPEEFDEWKRVAAALRVSGRRVIPGSRLIASTGEWEDPRVWEDNLALAHRQMDANNSTSYHCEAEAFKNTSHRSPADVRDTRAVAGLASRYAHRLGATEAFVGPSSPDCILTAMLVAAGVETIGIIQGNVQQMGARELFNAPDMAPWYHERALALHRAIPGVVAMPQIYASYLRAHATKLPDTFGDPWVYVGSASQFSRATEREIGTRAWFEYETESPLNVRCQWYGPGPRDDVFPRGRTYSVIVRGAQWCGADKPNERSWFVNKAGAVWVGNLCVGQVLPGSTIAVVSTETVAHLRAPGFIVDLPPLQQAGHIYGDGITSIEAWDRALTPAEIEAALRNPYPRMKP